MDDFTKRFWAEKVGWRERGDVTPKGRLAVRAEDGSHYVIGEEPPEHYHGFRGFGGCAFDVTFTAGPHAGRTVRTTNLWHQGVIPGELRESLPVNAEVRTTHKVRFQGYVAVEAR